MAYRGGHVRTEAIVVRAGEATALVALPAWRGAQILIPVATALLAELTGRPRRRLPGTRLTVAARLDAVDDVDLDLHTWQWSDPARHWTAA